MIGKFNTIGPEEEQAVLRVISSGSLSGFTAGNAYGGEEVVQLEEEWAKFFGMDRRSVVSCNSATSGLLAACMACGIGPFDEVIVPYFTMSATAAAPAVLGATVVLADIEPDTFCIDPNDVSALITENTKAVIATNMFGHPAKLASLRSMCDAAGIYLIEDNSQSIMAKENGLWAGTIGHIGVFSLNVHKHIQCGEGGVCFAEDLGLANRMRDAINHGENRKGITGLNLRMTEITAAIAREQLKKLPGIVKSRQDIGRALRAAAGNSDLLRMPTIRANCEHSFYAVPFFVEERYSLVGVLAMIRKNSPIPISCGYDGNLLTKKIKNVQNGEHTLSLAKRSSYTATHRLLLIETCAYDIKDKHIEEFAKAVCYEQR